MWRCVGGHLFVQQAQGDQRRAVLACARRRCQPHQPPRARPAETLGMDQAERARAGDESKQTRFGSGMRAALSNRWSVASLQTLRAIQAQW